MPPAPLEQRQRGGAEAVREREVRAHKVGQVHDQHAVLRRVGQHRLELLRREARDARHRVRQVAPQRQVALPPALLRAPITIAFTTQ